MSPDRGWAHAPRSSQTWPKNHPKGLPAQRMGHRNPVHLLERVSNTRAQRAVLLCQFTDSAPRPPFPRTRALPVLIRLLGSK